MKAVKTREYNLLGTMNTNPSNFYVPTHSSQNTTKKKHKLSPNDKFMKSFYSKQKSKAEYSPNGYRSISKEQIRNEIKKVVYGCRREDRYNIPLRGSEHADTQLQVIARESQNR